MSYSGFSFAFFCTGRDDLKIIIDLKLLTNKVIFTQVCMLWMLQRGIRGMS